MSTTDNPKLAVLIDADNASASLAKELLEEVAKFGVATVKRAYGDWTSQHLVGWKEALNRHAIQPIQQFAYTRGKNSTDASLIIDAMDLLYADNVDGFCLVSSDSDFTRLATRLRESRKVVYGLGERKTPEAFRAACDRFVFFEVLKRGGSSADATTREPASPIGDVPDLEQSLRQAFDAVSRDNGWATVSSVGSYMAKNNPSFDTRLYGFRKLSDMIRKQPFVEVKESTDANGGPLLAVRLKARDARGRDAREGREAPPPRDHARGRNSGSGSAAHRSQPTTASIESDPAPDQVSGDAGSESSPAPSSTRHEPRPLRDAREPATVEPAADARPAPSADETVEASPFERDDTDPAAVAAEAPARRSPRGRRIGGRAAAATGKAAANASDSTQADAPPSEDATPRAVVGTSADTNADAAPAAAKRPRRKRS